jgi:hypothetical protein
MSSSFRHRDAHPLDMAEFKAIVTASFDDIGSHVALNNSRALHSNRLAPPSSSSEDKTTTTTTRHRSPFSFLRKVKSHATSLLVPQSRSDSAASGTSENSRSFVPALVPVPAASRQPSPLSRTNLLNRALGKQATTHTRDHFPDPEPKSSFFDDDDDDEDDVDRRFFPQARRISSAPAGPSSRLFSAAAPTLFGLPSPSVSTPSLIPEKHGVVRPESRANIVHVCA